MATSDLFLFVSHVAENRIAAMEIVDELERRGTRCWIAPRDVRPGEPFDDEIAEAIETSRAMLLIFSDLCNDSQYIRREVTVAGESHKPVIPFRIEDVQPRKGLRVRLSDLHWIDGFTSRERAIDELVKKFSPSDSAPVQSAEPPDDDADAEQEQAFARAKDADTVAAFSAFIATFPKSHLVGDAQKAKDKLLARDEAYGRAMASDDPVVLESFLNSYPVGPQADKIRERLWKLQLKADDDKRRAEQKQERERAEQDQAFARAKDADTVAAFSAFIATYPNSHLARDAQEAKARLLARDEPPHIVQPKSPDRTTAPAPSNIAFLQVVCALLVLQGIARVWSGILVLSVYPWGIPLPLIFLWCCGPIVVISFFSIASLKRWARVLGWVVVGFGLIVDGILVLVSQIDPSCTHCAKSIRINLGSVAFFLSVVVDLVVIIYLIRGYRPVSRTA